MDGINGLIFFDILCVYFGHVLVNMDAINGALGHGPTSHRLLWLAGMKTAVAASNLAWTGTLTPLAIAHLSQAPATWVVALHGFDTGVDE